MRGHMYKNKKHDPSRRDFLRGMGGFTLALPFLHSLAPLQALAQVAAKKRFVAIHHYNGIFEKVWYPQVDVTAANGFTAHASDVFYKLLTNVQRTSEGYLSENFQKDFDSIQSKMNIYRGLDLIGGDDHDACHFLCGMQDLAESGTAPRGGGASIDQIMAKSSNFYQSAPAFRYLAAQEDESWSMSISWERNLTTNGIVRAAYNKRPSDLFNKVFAGLVADPVVQNKLASMKITIGDIVLADYKAKMNDRRISSEDKIRLSNFVDNLQEVQKKLSSMNPTPALTCNKPTGILNYDYFSLLNETQKMQYYNSHADIMAAAIACDLSRVCVITDNGFLSNHDYSHENPDSRDAQLQFMKYNRRAVQLVARLVNNLNSMVDNPSTGQTVLDNSLVMWGSEIGNSQSHRTESMPVVSFGGAGGAIKTGYYVDYRQRPLKAIAGRSDFSAMGRSYTQYLITVMRAMGLQQAEYNNYGDGGGFGMFASNVAYSDNAYEPYRQFRNQTLPFISNIS